MSSQTFCIDLLSSRTNKPTILDYAASSTSHLGLVLVVEERLLLTRGTFTNGKVYSEERQISFT